MDNTVVEINAVILCTGYQLDWSIMPVLEMDGACGIPLRTVADLALQAETTFDKHSSASNDEIKPHFPRLFQMIFPPRSASSIAVLSWMTPQENVWCVAELAAIAVAQTWAAETAKSWSLPARPSNHRSAALLPSLDEKNAHVDSLHAWFRKEWEEDHPIYSGSLGAYSFYRFLHSAAGTGLFDNLDHIFSIRGWKMWWEDHDLWTWLTRGPMNSYA